MANCKTVIRMGAGHYDLDMRVGDVATRVNLAEVPRTHLSGVAAIICEAHGIVLKHSPVAPAPRKGKKVRKATSVPRVGIFISPADITMEATL